MKLKNLFGMAAMAALVLSGCSNDEVVENFSPENAIEFGTYVGRDAQGRGSVYNDNVLRGTANVGFGVFAYYTKDVNWETYKTTIETIPNFMNNTQVEWEGKSIEGEEGETTISLTEGVWTYSPLKYWPNNKGDMVSFFAYAPYASERTLDKNATPVPANAIKVTVPVDVTNHQDYVVADAKLDQTKQTVTGTVKFEFKHVLSRVGFKVEAVVDEVQHEGTTDGSSQNGENDTDEGTKTLDENTEITIQEVELIGDFYKSNTIDFTTSTWNIETTGITKYDVTEDQWKGGYLLTSDDFNAIATDGSISTTKSTSLLNKDSEYMMIIPKEFKDNDLVKIRVKYTVTTTDSALPEGKSEVVNNITSDEFAFNFMKGKAYNFVLHLGLTSVKLSAEVSGWDEAEDIIVNVPINSDDDTTGGTSNTPSQGEGGGQQNTGGVVNP